MTTHLKNWKVWAHGLGAAFVGGASTALVDALSHVASGQPADWPQMLEVAAVAGALAAFGYLRQSPLPPSSPVATPQSK